MKVIFLALTLVILIEASIPAFISGENLRASSFSRQLQRDRTSYVSSNWTGSVTKEDASQINVTDSGTIFLIVSGSKNTIGGLKVTGSLNTTIYI